MGNPLRHLVLILAAAALTFASSLVLAQAAPSVIPINISPVASAPGGLQTMATYQASGAGAANGYYTRPVLVSNNTLAGLAKGMIRRATPVAAMLAAISAAGWVIDELTGQVMIPASGTQPPPAGSEVWCTASWGASFNSTMCGPSGQSFVGKNTGWAGGTYIVTAFIQTDSTFGHLQVNSGQVGGLSVQIHGYNPTTHQWIDSTPAQPVPDADLAPIIKENPHLWNDALRNPDGSVNRNPDVMTEADRLRQSLTNPDPVNNPVPNPQAEWDTGHQGGNPQNSPTSQEFPAFCQWASVVCNFIDWVKGTDDLGPDTTLPITEVPVAPSTWTSGLSGGSCPAPKQLTLSSWSGTVSMQPVCDLAGYIRPLVILSALLIGAFIIAGANKQNV